MSEKTIQELVDFIQLRYKNKRQRIAYVIGLKDALILKSGGVS